MPTVYRDSERLRPVFPIMLEQIIFEMAVEDTTLPPSHFAANLQLTAKRVRQWIRPILYRVFEYTRSPFPFPDFEAHVHVKLGDVGRFARHLVYGMHPTQDVEFLRDLLHHCSRISNLAVWYNPGMLVQVYPAFQSISGLRRLSAGLRGLTRDQILAPIFLNLTHLDLLGHINWDLIPEFKNLTHLSITDRPHQVEKVLASICDMDGCSSLRVIIMFEDPVTYYDPRLVIFRGYYDHLTDWINGANGRMDSWTFAERIVYAREKNYMRYGSNLVVNFKCFNYQTELNAEGQIWWQETQ